MDWLKAAPHIEFATVRISDETRVRFSCSTTSTDCCKFTLQLKSNARYGEMWGRLYGYVRQSSCYSSPSKPATEGVSGNYAHPRGAIGGLTPLPVLASWGCVRGVFLDGSAGIWGVFREVVSILLRSLVHEPIIHVGLRAYQQFTTQPIKPKSHQCQCRIYLYKLST